MAWCILNGNSAVSHCHSNIFSISYKTRNVYLDHGVTNDRVENEIIDKLSFKLWQNKQQYTYAASKNVIYILTFIIPNNTYTEKRGFRWLNSKYDRFIVVSLYLCLKTNESEFLFITALPDEYD